MFFFIQYLKANEHEEIDNTFLPNFELLVNSGEFGREQSSFRKKKSYN